MGVLNDLEDDEDNTQQLTQTAPGSGVRGGNDSTPKRTSGTIDTGTDAQKAKLMEEIQDVMDTLKRNEKKRAAVMKELEQRRSKVEEETNKILGEIAADYLYCSAIKKSVGEWQESGVDCVGVNKEAGIAASAVRLALLSVGEATRLLLNFQSIYNDSLAQKNAGSD